MIEFKIFFSAIITFIIITIIFFGGMLYITQIVEHRCKSDTSIMILNEHEKEIYDMIKKVKVIKADLHECQKLLKEHVEDEKNK